MTAGRRWVTVLAGVILIGLAAAVILLVVASTLQAQSDLYFSSTYGEGAPVAEEFDPELDAYYSALNDLAQNLGLVARSLLLAAIPAAFLLLALIAARRDRERVSGERRPAQDATPQAEATASS